MITIQRSGTSLSHTDQELDRIRQDFQRNYFVRLPNLISADLLKELYSQIMEASWEERIHDGIGVEVCLSDPGIAALINFLLNDQELFRVIEKITGCGAIGSFSGRVYRMVPDSGHYDSWHSDFGEHRLLALSLNLSKQIYEGGVLQIKERNSNSISMDVPNTEFGSAILFRLASDLEHRVTNVEGIIPKTAFAGWFRSEPDTWAALGSF